MNGFARGEGGQGVIEFALIVPPILLLLLLGMVEVGNLLNDAMTISSATREGARVGSALVNGGGALGCGSGQSPNAATVDPNIVAAVERVLTGSGARITLADVTEIRVWRALPSGAPETGQVNVWTYQLNGGPTVDGQRLDFVQQSQPWLPCTRRNVVPTADSIGVTVVYTYRGRTPLRMLVPFFNQFTVSDRTVMALNATR